VLFGASACATSYEPVRSPRVVVVRGALHAGYVKDGVSYPGGLFGGNVDEAVRGVPAAEEHARAYKTLTTAGTLTIFGSEGLAIGGSVASAISHDATSRDVQTSLIIGSGVALVTGFILHLVSDHHLYDAANLYNDALPAPSLSRPAQRSVPVGAPGAPTVSP
jgi:hypothetical protein